MLSSNTVGSQNTLNRVTVCCCYLFVFIYFYFEIMCKCVCVVAPGCNACGVQKRASDPLHLKEVVDCLPILLRTSLSSSARVVHALQPLCVLRQDLIMHLVDQTGLKLATVL